MFNTVKKYYKAINKHRDENRKIYYVVYGFTFVSRGSSLMEAKKNLTEYRRVWNRKPSCKYLRDKKMKAWLRYSKYNKASVGKGNK